MEWCYRALCILVSAVVVVACVISCSAPVRAHADETELLYQLPDRLQQYYYTGARQLDEVVNAVSTDLNNGNLTESSQLAEHVFTCYYLQNCLFGSASQQIGSPNWILGQAVYSAYEAYYHDYGSDFYNHLPDTISISSSGYTGLYRVQGSSDIHFATFFVDPFTVCTSDIINLNITVNNSNYSKLNITTFSNLGAICFSYSVPTLGNWSLSDSSGICQSYTSDRGYEFYFLKSGISIPTISNGTRIDTFRSAYVPMMKLAGSLHQLVPDSSIEKDTPWNYYNNILLPYMRTNFPDVPDKYFVFPNGYTPAVTPDIFSPSVNFGGVGVGGLGGIIAGAGAIINVGGVGAINVFAPIQGQIRIDGVQLQFPIDLPDSVYVNRNQVSIPTTDPLEIAGHVLDMISNTHFTFDGVDFTINADGTISISGTPYTLPIGTPTQPDTTPYEYMYEIPTMERIELIEPTIEPVGLSSFKDGITGLYGLGARLYYDLGLFRPLLICLGIAGVGYAISRIGGH